MKGTLNPNFKKEIARTPDGANVMNCYLCGTCTAGCPVAAIDPDYSPRTFMRMALAGLRDELLASPEIWKCSQCSRCTGHCPQNARPSDVIKALRDLAESENKVSAAHREKFEKIEDEIDKLRLEKIGAVISEFAVK